MSSTMMIGLVMNLSYYLKIFLSYFNSGTLLPEEFYTKISYFAI